MRLECSGFRVYSLGVASLGVKLKGAGLAFEGSADKMAIRIKG